jgi:cytidylate kinase
MYRIITLERECGCGDADIAVEIAGRLGWKLWDRGLTEEIAKSAGVDCSAVESCEERVDSPLKRVAKIFLHGSYERRIPMECAEPFDPDTFVVLSKNIIERIAAEGNCIIMGRGASYFLRERDDAFHVFLYAPHAEKLRRLLEAGKQKQEAEDLLDRVDRNRALFAKHYFGADWPTPSLHHLMINTATGNESVVSCILHVMRAMERREDARHMTHPTFPHQVCTLS